MGIKSVRVAMLILIIYSGATGFAIAQETKSSSVEELKKDCPSEGACELWEMFKEKYGPNWTVRWHGDRNIPRRISGKYQLDKGIEDKGEAEAVAWGIITDSKNLLGVEDVSDLKYRRVAEDKWTFIPEFDQYYKGILVYRGEVRVILNKNNTFEGMTNNFYPGINISIEPKIGKAEALWVVKRISNESFIEIAIDMPLIIKYTGLYIVPKTDDGTINYHLTWQVPMRNAIYFIDAEDGSQVHKVLSAVPSGGDTVSGDSIDSAVPSGSGTVSGGGIASAVPSLKYAVGVILLLTLIIIWRLKK